jgi:hypothetical protein
MRSHVPLRADDDIDLRVPDHMIVPVAAGAWLLILMLGLLLFL